jgi:hypothetical protein
MDGWMDGWMDSTKIRHKIISSKNINWTELAQNRDQWQGFATS